MRTISKRIVFGLLLMITGLFSKAQEMETRLLPFPEDWRAEVIQLPLDFAPELPFRGIEELRFSPGMFDRASAHYFTYVYGLELTNQKKFAEKEISTFLSANYRGLCKAVNGDGTFDIDYSKITVAVVRRGGKKVKGRIYDIEILFYDPFTNGKKVVLYAEMIVDIDKKEKVTHIFTMVSPADKTTVVWKELHEIYAKTILEKLKP